MTPSPRICTHSFTQLELREFAMAGFSMVVRRSGAATSGKYGSKGREQGGIHLRGSALSAEDAGQSGGCGRQCLRGDREAIVADRYAFFTEFFKNFYNADLLLGKRVSEQGHSG